MNLNTDNTKDFSQVTIILPTLNEAKNIELLLDKLTDFYSKISIIVSDDNSNDGTQDLVLAFKDKYKDRDFELSLIQRNSGQIPGLTASVIDGIFNVNSEFVAVMDADLQHPPEIVKIMYSKLISEKADIVVGARLPFKEQQGLHRVIITYISTQIAHFILSFKGQKVKDPMSGLFIVNTNLIQKTIKDKKENFELSGYKILFDFLKSADRKLKILNCDYDFGIRPGGKSKLKPKHAFYFFRSLFRL